MSELAENKQKPIPSKRLRKAFESLRSPIGRTVIEGFISDLENYGIMLDRPDSAYSLFQIEDAITKLFGKDESDLFMEHLKSRLREI